MLIRSSLVKLRPICSGIFSAASIQKDSLWTLFSVLQRFKYCFVSNLHKYCAEFLFMYMLWQLLLQASFCHAFKTLALKKKVHSLCNERSVDNYLECMREYFIPHSPLRGDASYTKRCKIKDSSLSMGFEPKCWAQSWLCYRKIHSELHNSFEYYVTSLLSH